MIDTLTEKPAQEQVSQPETPNIDRILDSIKVGLSGLGGADTMRKKLEESVAARQVIDEYIAREFKKGTDYGVADDRSSKDTLLKAGAEKACHLFDTHPEWRRDDEIWEMLGRPAGVVCLKCLIVDNKTGAIIGEGRGAEKVGNKARDANKAIKAAERNSIVDAAMYTFMLSERFTQDDGHSRATVTDAGRALMQSVTEWRSGCNSEMTDNQFVIKVCQNIVHKKQMGTVAEVEMVRKAILEDFAFDKETGDKIGL